jgi:hypothetical protein
VRRRDLLKLFGLAPLAPKLFIEKALEAPVAAAPVAPALVFNPCKHPELFPERWASESLRLLEDQRVMSQLIHRDFEFKIGKL